MNKDIKRLDLNTPDGTQLNMDALYQIAPSVFTESRDEKTGVLKRVVNFDALRQLLGDNAVDESRETYEFRWVGKDAAKSEAARAIDKTLRPVVEDSVDWDTTKNLYIEGDNLEVLKLLQRSYMGKVKMIYIDPPYNTGNDFVYHDYFDRSKYEEELASGAIDELGLRYLKSSENDGKFHSNWCNMIYPRLMVARSLLAEDGVILISIDDHEQEHLKNICDEIFGEANYIGKIAVVNNLKGRNDKKDIATCHEYLCMYGKTEFAAGGMPLTEEQKLKFDKRDEKGNPYQLRDLRKRGRPDRREDRPNMFFPIYYNVERKECSLEPQAGWIEILPLRGDGSDGRWRWGKDRVKQNLSILEPRYSHISGRWGIEHRVYLNPTLNPVCNEDDEEELEERVSKSKSFWMGGDLSSDVGRRQLKELFENAYFDYPKSIGFIINTLYMGAEQDSIILDFFSGSATTAHAVMQLNAEDGGNRKFIMVQLPEETPEDSEAYKAGYKNICEIGKERIRRAGKKIKEEHPEVVDTLDTGFRVFRLDDSNFNPGVKKSPSEYDQQQLDLFANNIKSDRNDLDLLFGSILAWGLQLDLPMETEKVDGCKIYTVNEGDLVACFAEKVNDKVIAAMAEKEPLRVLFRDSCFDSDDKKINIFETFKQKLDWTDDEAFNNIRVI